MCKAVIKEKQPFERLEISKETLLKMFKVRKRALISTHSLGFCVQERKTYTENKSGDFCCMSHSVSLWLSHVNWKKGLKMIKKKRKIMLTSALFTQKSHRNSS